MLDGGPGEKAFGLGAVEAGMHSGNVVECLRNAHPARQHGDVGDERYVTHKLVALGPGIAPQDIQIPLIRGEAEDGVECRGFAGAIGADEPKDASFFDAQVDAIQRDGATERFAQAACFDACHGLDSSSGSGPSLPGTALEW